MKCSNFLSELFALKLNRRLKGPDVNGTHLLHMEIYFNTDQNASIVVAEDSLAEQKRSTNL